MTGTTNESVHHQPHDRDGGRRVQDRPQGRPRHAALLQPLRDRLGARDGHARTSGPSRSRATGAARATARSCRWPNGIAARGEIRNQFAHVIDVAPTVLEAAGIPEPSTVHGVTQRPYEGTPMNYSFDDGDADEQHTTQYFEMLGNRAIFHKGWTAVAKHKDPWLGIGPRPRRRRLGALQRRGGLDPVARPRRRRSPSSSPSCSGCSSSRPRGSTCCRSTSARPSGSTPRSPDVPTLVTGTSQTFYPGMKRLSENSVVNLKNKSFTVTASGDRPGRRRRAECSSPRAARTAAGRSTRIDGKLGLRLQHHRDQDRLRPLRRRALDARRARSRARTSPTRAAASARAAPSRSSTATTCVGEGRVERTLPFFFSMDETVDIGADLASPVSPRLRRDRQRVHRHDQVGAARCRRRQPHPPHRRSTGCRSR